MANYEQRFFSALRESFIGHKTKGKSGYVNLLDLKNKFFSQIEPYIKKEIENSIDESAREDAYQKLYTFFDAYLNETGTVFFSKTHIHNNIYEKIYDDRNDVALFWKTKQLYYVKTETLFDDLETTIGNTTFVFDASEIKHKKANEKKELAFHLTNVEKNKVTFKVRYKSNNEFTRLKEILGKDKKNDIIDYLLENYGSTEKTEINFIQTNLDKTIFNKNENRKNIYIEEKDDLLKSVKVEYSISDLDLIHKYLNKTYLVFVEKDTIEEAFAQYKRQKVVDYFIHKNAETFLKEQFDIYMYNWLFNDIKTDFDEKTVKRIQNIKKIAYKIIEYIARFEDELKAIWEKPKFVRKANYVVTLDKLTDEIINKIANHPNLKDQIDEWQQLGFVDEDFNFEDIYQTDTTGKQLNEKYKYLPIDTKYFKDIEYEILDVFEHLDQALDGVLIKSDNWQALNTIKEKYKERIQTIYIDPPFNTGKDFEYVDNFQDSTWLTLMNDRILLAKDFLKDSGSFFLHLDDNADYLGRFLMNNIFQKNNYRNNIIWTYNGKGLTNVSKKYVQYFSNILFYSKNESKLFVKNRKNGIAQSVLKRFGKLLNENNQITFAKLKEFNENAELEKARKSFIKNYGYEPEDDDIAIDYNRGVFIKDIWDDIGIIRNSKKYIESIDFSTQKPERLLYRIIVSTSKIRNYILDFFSGSGTTIATSHKLNRNWIGIEVGEHFYSINIPRIKKVLFGVISGISKELEKEKKLNKGGFFKYYELEQYEEVLAKAQYQWREKDSEVEKYSFMQDQKLLEAIEIDYKKKNAKLVFEKLYDDIDLAETFSNLLGESIKKVAKDYCILTDHDGKNEMKIDYKDMTFEKYPWIKPLIWWHSK